jgi:hypothetical protein
MKISIHFSADTRPLERRMGWGNTFVSKLTVTCVFCTRLLGESELGSILVGIANRSTISSGISP